MPLLLVLIFIVVPIAELYVIVQVGQAIGILPTIALLLLDSVAGAALMRHQGRSAWRRFQAAMGQGRAPTREVLDGVLVIFGGAFLITPGFITDIIGFLLLLPPTRALFRGLLVRSFASRMVAKTVGQGLGAGARYRNSRRSARPGAFDVESSATEVPREQGRLP